jgi:uncharacterized membrane protein
LGGVLAWPLLACVTWLLLYRVERRDAHGSLAWGHAGAALVLAAVIEWELVWRLTQPLGLVEGWRMAAFALVPLLLLLLVTYGGGWPLARWRFAYGLVVGGVLATALSLWVVWSWGDPGGARPLPWVPLLNPLDLVSLAALISLVLWWRRVGRDWGIRFGAGQPGLIWAFFGGLAFVWINVALLRGMHHWGGIAYEPGALLHSVMVQSAMSLLWGVTGVSLLLAARKWASRGLWIGGACVLAAVVAKLFLVDLAATGTLERIVSFLAVGTLLVAIGWFSPLPPRAGSGSR